MSDRMSVPPSPHGDEQSRRRRVPAARNVARMRDVRAPRPATFSRAAWLVDVLVERVVNGTYAQGQRIREAELQEEFGFSNGPIREALQQLVARGLATRAPWQGVRVVEHTREDVVALFELRGALLERAAELAASRVDDDDRRSAEVLRATLRRKFAASRAGHQPPVTGDTTEWVLAVARNRYISEIWHQTMLKSRIFVYDAMKRTAGARTEPLIGRLVDAILAGDSDSARLAARAFTRQVLVDIGLG
ncbi:MAG: GntR family transcriptional regulator [Betaproteobacteria bacterium]|nr:MAG: GntR family transcriptional regulator [Betaproteobacteria bacterium]